MYYTWTSNTISSITSLTLRVLSLHKMGHVMSFLGVYICLEVEYKGSVFKMKCSLIIMRCSCQVVTVTVIWFLFFVLLFQIKLIEKACSCVPHNVCLPLQNIFPFLCIWAFWEKLKYMKYFSIRQNPCTETVLIERNTSVCLNDLIGRMSLPTDTTCRRIPAAGIKDLCCHSNNNTTCRCVPAAGTLDFCCYGNNNKCVMVVIWLGLGNDHVKNKYLFTVRLPSSLWLK